jgi:hypothetical protein
MKVNTICRIKDGKRGRIASSFHPSRHFDRCDIGEPNVDETDKHAPVGVIAIGRGFLRG